MNLMMMFVIPIPFIFVLLILLLDKAPKVGAGVIGGVVIMGLLGAVLWLGASHRRVAYEQSTEGLVIIKQQTQPSTWAAPDVVYEGFRQTRGAAVESVTREPAVTAPIWSEGVENEYEADIYPSRLAAARAFGSRIDKTVRELVGDVNLPAQITLFQEVSDRTLILEIRNAIRQAVPQASCAIEADLRDLRPNEVGVTMWFSGMGSEPAPWASSSETSVVDGTVEANVFTMAGNVIVHKRFAEKPWVENFAGFAGLRPKGHFVVARSSGACTSENEAKVQAIRDACDQVSALVGRKWSTMPGRPALTVSSTDLLEGGFIVDQFVQSFDGMSGRFWRQAMLIDTSAEKLSWLGSRKSAEVHVVRTTLAHMIVSALGVLLVIVATYLFLNMATRGYYVWSLRIAGAVLAIMGIISIILVLR